MPHARPWLVCLISAMLIAGKAQGGAISKPAATEKSSDGRSSSRQSICLLVESAASAHRLPVEFFARVIWQESRFRPDAIGPPTRSGARAQGIAQFMPMTARDRDLLDPLDPVQALPKSAEYLDELRREFGNLGLAAAAYNAGPQRVRDWLAGTRTLPGETRNYVSTVTGTSVEQWAKAESEGKAHQRAAPNCRALVALLKSEPSRFVDALEQRLRLGAMQPWGVQLSGGFSRGRVVATYATLARRYASILEGHDASIVTSTLRSRGTHPFYRIRVGTRSRADADHLCSRIRHSGGACAVLRNPRR